MIEDAKINYATAKTHSGVHTEKAIRRTELQQRGYSKLRVYEPSSGT